MEKKQNSMYLGFSLIEVLVYVAILLVFSGAVVSGVISLGSSYTELRITQTTQRSALTLMDRVAREIRRADMVDITNSTFDAHPGVLVLGRDSGGAPQEVEFYVTSGVVRIRENGVDVGALTSSDISVTNLVFRLVQGSVSTGVRIELTLEGGIGNTIKSKDFYTFAVTR